MNAMISIEDDHEQFTVITDVSQGGSSLRSGELELMVRSMQPRTRRYSPTHLVILLIYIYIHYQRWQCCCNYGTPITHMHFPSDLFPRSTEGCSMMTLGGCRSR